MGGDLRGWEQVKKDQSCCHEKDGLKKPEGGRVVL